MNTEKEHQPNDWLVWSHEHKGYRGWGGLGYTPDVTAAARYTYAQARAICAQANRCSNRIEECMINIGELLQKP